MIVVLAAGTSDEQRDAVARELEDLGLGVRALIGGDRPLLHVVSGPTRRARRVLRADCVEALVPTSGPRLRRVGHRIYPYHFVRWCAAGVVLFGAMVCLAGQFPPGTGAAVDPSRPPETLAWPWYLRAPLAVLRLGADEPRLLGAAVLAALVLALYALPLIDRTRGAGWRSRWPFALAAAALLVAAAYGTLQGAG